jgi:hypothetical protein
MKRFYSCGISTISKISTFALAVIIVLSIGFFSACEEKDDTNKTISITEIDLNTDESAFKDYLNDREVYVVNTQEDYEALLSLYVTDLPQIDFSKHSFVIIWSQTGCLLDKTIDFSSNSSNSYDLKINLHLGDCASVDFWYSAFITHTKIADNATINLNVNEYD